MGGEGTFKVEGNIVEAFPNGTYRVELPNGHRLLGFLTGRAKRSSLRLSAGDKVTVVLSPFDLSEGRIIVANS
ncbi:MAG TPA: translation initiation factor IF-1 [Clostridia bacterium]|nr:translation initiation factor IF-1 [Clostridia bacterium]